MTKEIILWHGGRNLESNYKESLPAKGLWEHGPGLYLTTSYERAVKYAKGGGKTYMVSVEDGKFAKDVQISSNNVFEFITDYVIGKKKLVVAKAVHENMKRMSNSDSICAETFLNIMINEEAITKSKSHLLNDFLVENKVDFNLVKNYGGANETVLVILNRDKIKKVAPISAKNVSLDDFDLNFEFKEKPKSTLKL